MQVGVGKSSAGLTTKIHALVNESGKLIQFIITPGNRHDSVVAKELLDCAIKPDIYVLADRGYSSSAIRSYVLSNKAIPVIPPTSNRKLPWIYDKEIYKHRNHVERLSQRLKTFRRVSTRYDKSLESFVSFLYLASSILINAQVPPGLITLFCKGIPPNSPRREYFISISKYKEKQRKQNKRNKGERHNVLGNPNYRKLDEVYKETTRKLPTAESKEGRNPKEQWKDKTIRNP